MSAITMMRTGGRSGTVKRFTNSNKRSPGHLPREADGKPVPRPEPVKSLNPYEHPDAKRRFKTVDSKDALREALEYPWEQWIVFLHPTQRRVVERSYRGPARVSGAAGTGKTVVALHRAAHLARKATSHKTLPFSRIARHLLKQRVEPACKSAGVPWRELSDESPVSTPDISVGAMHRAKGLEFKAAFVMGCDDKMLPLRTVLDRLDDPADRDSFIDQERRLLYVACTRARERLFVTCAGARSQFVP